MTAKWAFLVYMAGNNSLSKAAGVDLGEMEKVGSTEAVQVLAFTKQRAPKSAFHVRVGKGTSSKTDLGNVDSGDPKTLSNFVRWGVREAPAERYALVVWNHGSGWEPDDLEQLYSSPKASAELGVGFRELNLRSNHTVARSLFTTTLRKILTEQTHIERAIACDDGSGHSLDALELGRVIEQAAEETGKPIDVLGMDACLMSGIDVCYQVGPAARNIIASEELEPEAGWPYEALLSGLNKAPDMTGKDLAELAVRCFVDSYRDDKRVWPVTLCAVDTMATDQLASAVDHLVQALGAQLPQGWPEILKARANSVEFEMHLTDLASLCKNLAVGNLGDDVPRAAKAILAVLKPGGFVTAEGHLGPKVEDCGGVTVYFPSPPTPISKYYKDLRFAGEHQWDEFLKKYRSAVLGH